MSISLLFLSSDESDTYCIRVARNSDNADDPNYLKETS